MAAICFPVAARPLFQRFATNFQRRFYGLNFHFRMQCFIDTRGAGVFIYRARIIRSLGRNLAALFWRQDVIWWSAKTLSSPKTLIIPFPQHRKTLPAREDQTHFGCYTIQIHLNTPSFTIYTASGLNFYIRRCVEANF